MTSLLLLLLFADVATLRTPQATSGRLSETAAAEIPKRIGVDVLQRKLTLTQAIEAALKNNLEIEIEKTNRATATQQFRGAKGFLDPKLIWQPGIESRATPTGSVLLGANGKLSEHFHNQNFAFQQRLPWAGSGLSINFDNSRQSTSNPFTGLTPFFQSRLGFTFTQPLLRGREADRDRTEWKIRRKFLDISDLDFEAKVIDVVSRTETAYWTLVAARQDVEVAADSVSLAREQLARNKRQIDAGTLAPVELAASEAELERRRDTLFAAVAQITEAENVLKTLLAPDRADGVWSEELLPVDLRSPSQPPEVFDLKEIVNTAVGKRVELRGVKARLDVNAIEHKQAADLTKPQVNLIAGYYHNGLGGSVSQGDNPFTASNVALYERLNRLSAAAGLPPVPAPSFGGLPAALIGGYGTTLSNVFGGRYQTAQVGLSFDFTFRNNAAEAGLAQTAIAERRLKLQTAQIEQIVEAQVRSAVQSIASARQRVSAAQAAVRAAGEKLESEIRLFQTGESTNFLVLTRQNEMAESRRREVFAQSELNKAIARYEQALGATLETFHLSLK